MEAAEKIYERINSVKEELDLKITVLKSDLESYKKENDHAVGGIKQSFKNTESSQLRLEKDLNEIRDLISGDLKEIKECLIGNEKYNRVGLVKQFLQHVIKTETQFLALDKDLKQIKADKKTDLAVTDYKKWLRRVFIGLGGWIVGYIIQYLIKKYG